MKIFVNIAAKIGAFITIRAHEFYLDFFKFDLFEPNPVCFKSYKYLFFWSDTFFYKFIKQLLLG